MKYDIESILEMYEDDYTPSAMVPGPRNMKLAEVSRSEMDNFNTPDLDQGADSILRPGETLEDFDVEFRRPNAQGGRIDFNEGGDATRLKALEADYIQFGKKKLNKAAKVLGFEDYASMSGQENNNFRRKIKQQLTKYGEVLPKGYDSDVRGRKTRIPKEQNIQIKLLEETNKKNFFDPKQFAIDNDISLAKVKKQAERLQTNIYKKRMLEAGKDVGVTLEWIPKDPKFSDNTLNKLWKSKLIKYEREKIDELFYDAFGREKIKGTNKKNPSFNNKKFLAIKKNLNEYRKLRNGINAKYPNINFELDHPLSKSTLKKMFNASAEELTRVNPLEADLNNGFKDAVSQQYEKAMGDSKKGIKPNLNKKKAVEKIARDLKLNIGKINNDATNFKYGVKEFQKLNMKDEILKAVQNQEYLSSNFKTYVKNNPELFKTANVNPNTNITKITQGQVKQVASLLEKLGCGQAAGGRILFAEGVPSLTKCGKAGAAKIEKGLANGFKKSDVGLAQKILGSGKFLKEAVSLRGLFGPAALAFTVAAEAGIVGYDMLASGKSFREAIGDSVFNYALGDKTKIDSDEEFMKRLKNIKVGPQGYQRMGDAEIGKMLNFKTNLDDMKRGFDLYGKLDAIGENRKQIGNNPEDTFSEGAFQLDLNKQEDAVRADIRDYNKTGTPRRVTDYLLSDKAKEGADATAYANLLVKEDQLKNAGTGDFLPKVDQGIARNLKQTQYGIDNLLNPKKLDEFGEYFVSRPKSEQSYMMGLGYKEGGIASLNVKK